MQCTQSINTNRSISLSVSFVSLQLRPILQCAYIQHNTAIIKYSSVWSQFWHDSYSINSFSKVLFFLAAVFFPSFRALFPSRSLHHLWERPNAMTKLWEDPWNKFTGLYTHTTHGSAHGCVHLCMIYTVNEWEKSNSLNVLFCIWFDFTALAFDMIYSFEIQFYKQSKKGNNYNDRLRKPQQHAGRTRV